MSCFLLRTMVAFLLFLCFTRKYKIPKGANSYGEQTLSLKNRKTTILNSQSIRMLQTHVKNNIYNKYCLIHNTINIKQCAEQSTRAITLAFILFKLFPWDFRPL